MKLGGCLYLFRVTGYLCPGSQNGSFNASRCIQTMLKGDRSHVAPWFGFLRCLKKQKDRLGGGRVVSVRRREGEEVPAREQG